MNLRMRQICLVARQLASVVETFRETFDLEGRYLDRRGGDGGYMVITQCADLTPRRARCEALGVRIANEIQHGDYHELQLHPRDVGAAMLSFSRQEGGEAPDGPW